MTDLTQANIRKILKEEVPAILKEEVAAILKEEVPAIIKELVPGIVRQETADIRDELGSQSMRLKAVQIDVSQVKQSVRKHAKEITGLSTSFKSLDKEVTRLGGLYEDLDGRFKADSELLRSNFEIKDQVTDHEDRLNGVENVQVLMKRTLREHSDQLKTRPA